MTLWQQQPPVWHHFWRYIHVLLTLARQFRGSCEIPFSQELPNGGFTKLAQLIERSLRGRGLGPGDERLSPRNIPMFLRACIFAWVARNCEALQGASKIRDRKKRSNLVLEMCKLPLERSSARIVPAL